MPDAPALPCFVTRYGFHWAGTNVVRLSSHKGSIVLGIETARHRCQVYVTPTGLIRIYEKPAKHDGSLIYGDL